MKNPILWTMVLLAADPVFASEIKSAEKTKDTAFRSEFSLLPKAFQKDPWIDCNIITEVMPPGKKLRAPSLEKPAYYALQPGYYQHLGEAAPSNIKPPPVAELTRAMIEALAVRHYYEASSPQKPPTLIVVFSYGDHSATSGEAEDAEAANAARIAYDEEVHQYNLLIDSLNKSPLTGGISEAKASDLPPPPEPPSTGGSGLAGAEQLLGVVLSDKRKYRELIDRAGLVGGVAFATELGRTLKQEINFRSAGTSALSSRRLGDFKKAEAKRNAIVTVATGIEQRDTAEILSSPVMGMDLSHGPFHLFYERNQQTMHLIEEAFSSCYFVIASAYDGAALAKKGEKRLLWRTKMTVNSIGVNMADTLPVLIRTAGAYFGRDMTEAATISKPIFPQGRVEIGKGTIVDDPNSIPPSTTKEKSHPELPKR